jgi:hypothetical protein
LDSKAPIEVLRALLESMHSQNLTIATDMVQALLLKNAALQEQLVAAQERKAKDAETITELERQNKRLEEQIDHLDGTLEYYKNRVVVADKYADMYWKDRDLCRDMYNELLRSHANMTDCIDIDYDVIRKLPKKQRTNYHYVQFALKVIRCMHDAVLQREEIVARSADAV